MSIKKDFLSEITCFSKDSLTKVSTVVTLPSGKKVIEKQEAGTSISRVLDTDSLGFVVDTDLDLTVGKILPFLVVGMYAIT